MAIGSPENTGLTGEHPEGHAAERVEVGGLAAGAPGDALGRHVGGRAGQDAVGGEVGVVLADRLHETEVEHLDDVEVDSEPAQEEVVRLDVAVQQPGRVRLGQRAARLSKDRDGTRCGQGAEALNEC